MYANIGDVIIIKNFKFKDSNKLDLNLNGRPVLIIHKNEKYFYCIIYTTSPYRKEMDKYFSLASAPDIYIDLKYIYKIPISTIIPTRHVGEDNFKLIINAFMDYQENVQPDEFYQDICFDLKSLKFQVKLTRKKSNK